jgi:hypothetical protein
MRITKPRGRKTINVALAALVMLGAAFLPQPVLSSPDLVTLRPNGPGNYTEFDNLVGAPTHWEAVDDVTPDDDSTYVDSATFWDRDTYALTDSGIPAGSTINSVTVYVYAKRLSAGLFQGWFFIMIRSGTTNDFSQLKVSTTNYGLFSHEWTTDPNTGSAWTIAAVDALEAGAVALTGVRVSQVYVEVDYTPPSLPTVNSVTLTDTSMSPQMEYTASVNVSHGGGKAGLDTLVLKVYYDSNGGTPTDAEAEGQTADTQNCAILTWTESSDTFAIEPSSSTTWSLGTCSSPASLPGDFTFVFTPGKVASQTTGSAVWQIWAKATDDVSQTDTGYDDTPPAMNWYGEVTVDTPSVDWGTVDLGSVFSDNPQTDISVTYICNGTYDQQVKSDGSWSGSGVSITLDAAGIPGVKEFSMKADDTAVLGSAVLVSTSYVTIDSGSQTGEAGNVESTYTLWLKLGASGIPAVTYNGTIYYQIVPD